jgi:hypothetical protein
MAQVGSSGNSRTMDRMTGRPVSVAFTAWLSDNSFAHLIKTHLSKDIRHQPQLCLDHLSGRLDGTVTIFPRYPVRARPMESRLYISRSSLVFIPSTYMGRPETQCDPSTVDCFWGSSLKSSNIMRPKSESRAGQTEATSNSLCHSFEGRLAITSPVDRELLTSGSS